MTACLVRAATPEDAPAAIAVLRDAIVQLCAADHQHDPVTIERWLQNKTLDHFQRWLTNGANYLIVAERDEVLCGVGSLELRGEIQLCYVAPGQQRSGVGRALLHALELEAKRLEIKEIRLRSTCDARLFYERHGYVSAGEPALAFGVLRAYPYVKVLDHESVVS